MKFDYALIENELDEGLGKNIAGAAVEIGLTIALLAGHSADMKNLNAAQRVIKTELSSEIRDLVQGPGSSKQDRQRATRQWSDIIQQAKEINPELANVTSLYRAGVAIINNPSLLDKES